MKESGIEWLGLVPKEWKVSKLKYFSDKITQGPNPNYDLGEPEKASKYRVLKTKDLYDSAILYDNSDLISVETYNSCKKSALKNGDILMGIVGKGSIGKVNVFDNDTGINYIFTRALGLIRVNNKLKPRFLNYILRSNYGKETINNGIIGSTGQEVLQTAYIARVYIPIPDKSEQKYLISFLDKETRKIDLLLLKMNKYIDLLKQAKQSLISEAVTGKIDLRDWEIIEEGEI